MNSSTPADDSRQADTLSRLRVWLPSRGNVLFTILLLGLVLGAGRAGALPLNAPGADPPSTFAYQGRLADSNGAPLTDTYTMVFRVYNSAAGGAPLWEEQWTGSNSVKVSDGLFNVMLGSLTAIPKSVVTGNSTLWLGITVGTDNEMTPRIQLGSVPTAIQALTVPDGSITTAQLADGSVTLPKLATNTFPNPAVFNEIDNTFVVVQGIVPETSRLKVSEFTFADVPPGDIAVLVTLTARKYPGASSAGSLYLVAPDTAVGRSAIDTLNLTFLRPDYDQLTLHGKIPNFAGGTLTIRLEAASTTQDANIEFGGYNNHYQFGRRITLMAGQ